jgi:hypothetical protein
MPECTPRDAGREARSTVGRVTSPVGQDLLDGAPRQGHEGGVGLLVVGDDQRSLMQGDTSCALPGAVVHPDGELRIRGVCMLADATVPG